MKQILNDPTKLQEEMALVQRNLAALQNAEQSMRNPHKRQQVPGRERALDWHVWQGMLFRVGLCCCASPEND